MDEVVGELDACLAELDGKPGGDATMISRSPVVKQSRQRRVRTSDDRRRVGPGLLALFGILLAAAVFVGFVLVRDDAGGDGAGTPGPGDGDAPVQVQGVSSYDPFGDDGEEHPESVGEATDGDAATYWTTSTYQGFSATKEGVGLVLDAGDGGGVSSFTVTSDTPGFTAEIRSGESAEGPFENVVSPAQNTSAETTWELESGDARYYALWITDMAPGSAVRVNEVSAG